MEALFADGRVIDIAIAVLVAEMLWVALARHRRGHLLPTLLSGLMLLLAWRAHAAGLPWPWVAAPMTLSGLCHVGDLLRRWPKVGPAPAVVLATDAAPVGGRRR